MFTNYSEAAAAFEQDRPRLEALGISWAHGARPRAYVPDGFGARFDLAMDAQPSLTSDPSGGIPALLTTMIDPTIYEMLFAPNRAATIFGEIRRGSWVDETVMFPQVEHTGEVTSYGDYSESGSAGTNMNFPQRQAYLFQTIKNYGERELERAGLAKINYVSEIDKAAVTVLNKFSNLTYFFGVAGLQNYGLINDPNLSAAQTPITKAAGGATWVTSGGVINATANEVFIDIENLFIKLVSQTAGLIQMDSKVVLAMSPTSAVALTATNSFNVNVFDLLKKNFPNIRLETAVQYGVLSAANPQGVAAGNLVQLIAEEIEGQDVGYCAFNEKMRAHKLIVQTSSFKQKITGGTWGSVIRLPAGIAQLLGV
jgi:hypothetical protein